MKGVHEFWLANTKSTDEQTLAYRVVWKTKPKRKEQAFLAKLLDAQPSKFSQGYLVVDKLGLLSPWSAKAKTVLTNCQQANILQIQKIEYLTTKPLVWDRLLQQCLNHTEGLKWLEGQQVTSDDANTSYRYAPNPKTLKAIQKLEKKLERKISLTETALLEQTCSEHCRHFTFMSKWDDDNTSLLEILASTHNKKTTATAATKALAFSDHAAIIPSVEHNRYTVAKGETHNHPTAIAPWSGAATGVGGEIRDEVAVGTGAKTVAGCAGYMLSYVDYAQTKSLHSSLPLFASAKQILHQAPLGTSTYANEFGRPTLTGFCRFVDHSFQNLDRGFVKPVMFAAGMGEVTANNMHKQSVAVGNQLVLLGGPSMLVGMSGASASSSTEHDEPAIYSVQRADPLMQRRMYEVICNCIHNNLDLFVCLHDLGAGGLGVALAELVKPLGAKVNLDLVPLAQQDMQTEEILINEAQERFLVAVEPNKLKQLEEICKLENCPFTVIGEVTDTCKLEIKHHEKACVNLEQTDIFNLFELPTYTHTKPVIKTQPINNTTNALDMGMGIDLQDACAKLIAHPNVGDKSFLISICDRGVGGKVNRDQFVGPCQVAVADCAVSLFEIDQDIGQAMACGERPLVASLNPASGARLSVAESLTNLACAVDTPLNQVKLSLNWLGNNKDAVTRGELVYAVRNLCADFLNELGLEVVVGKDSLSMSSKIKQENTTKTIMSPTCCIATAYGSVANVKNVLTPQLCTDEETYLMRINTSILQPLGASVFAECFNLQRNDVADVTAKNMYAWWQTIAELRAQNLILAYHDISDGGLFATISEMCFATDCGAHLVLDSVCQPTMGLDAEGYEQSIDVTSAGGQAIVAAQLFNEQPGAIIQVAKSTAHKVLAIAQENNLPGGAQTIGWPVRNKEIKVIRNAQTLVNYELTELKTKWSSFCAQVKANRDHEQTINQEFSHPKTQVKLYATPHIPAIAKNLKHPNAVILRDQGTNGHIEMEWALNAAGFTTSMLTVQQLVSQEKNLNNASLLVIPGGFSHGDVFGAGRATAAILNAYPQLIEQLQNFLKRDSLLLGVCNGAQIFSNLLTQLADTKYKFPSFETNASTRFECRLAQVEILPNNSPFLAPLAGVRLPVPVSCHQGRITNLDVSTQIQPVLRFCNQSGLQALTYPANVTGSVDGICGLSSTDGKVTLLMPHPERAIHRNQLSWCPPSWKNQTTTPWHDSFVQACNFLC